MKKLNLDTFGEIMNNFIKDNEIRMLITLPEGTVDPLVEDNCNAGSVLQFYIVLNAISGIGQKMKKEMGIDGDKWEMVVDLLLELVRRDLTEEKKVAADDK